ncbi:hypothetical protein R5R35_002994 [Gryllus longicercus]|uniref:DDE Tnp4 domain-containing protein n=1 Tax=Gryllus longicercus TaxID=2509291 RepID=A0AAN9VPU5_9ORTH
MASIVGNSDRRALLNVILKELTSDVKSPAYDYLKNSLVSSRPHLVGALACAAETNKEEVLSSSFPHDDCEFLLNTSNDEFYQLFKFRKQTIKDLIQLMEHRLLEGEDEDGTPVTVTKKVLMTCWLMTSAEEYFMASEVFNISVSSVVHIFLEVCEELTKLTAQFVNWPSDAEQTSIIEAFEMTYGFPGVVGVIGSTAFNISHPVILSDDNHYYNPASDQHSIVIQAVCDQHMVFRDVCAGVPSRRTSAEILRDSPLYLRLVNRSDPLMKPQTFILGSSDYPQLPNLLTPYAPEARGRPLDNTESSFNKQHAAVESIIHKCFDILRVRFSKLKYINIPDNSKATHVVLAACVLHNFALFRGDIMI